MTECLLAYFFNIITEALDKLGSYVPPIGAPNGVILCFEITIGFSGVCVYVLHVLVCGGGIENIFVVCACVPSSISRKGNVSQFIDVVEDFKTFLCGGGTVEVQGFFYFIFKLFYLFLKEKYVKMPKIIILTSKR